MKYLFYIITIFSLISCRQEQGSDELDNDNNDVDSTEVNAKIDSLDKESISNYDLSTVDKENSEEFMENLVKIEKEYGEQWDFCTCVVKNDSINKAFSNPLGDDEFDRLFERSDVIESRCKAFLIQSPNSTPEERDEHERKVRKCLKEAGIK